MGVRIHLLSVALNGGTANPALERVIRKIWGSLKRNGTSVSNRQTNSSIISELNLL